MSRNPAAEHLKSAEIRRIRSSWMRPGAFVAGIIPYEPDKEPHARLMAACGGY
jgi:hypothetical protein